MKKYHIDKSLQYNKTLSEKIPSGRHSNFKVRSDTPLYFKSASQSRIVDLDGNEYLDMYGYSGAAFLGHDNPLFKKRLHHYCAYETDKRADFQAADLIGEHVPSADMVRYSLSGSEAIQNALRLSRACTGRMKVLKFEGHYHGSADNILGGTYDPMSFPIPGFDDNDPNHSEGIVHGVMQTQMIVIPWNDINMLVSVMDKYGNEIAAVIMEPISVNAGSIMPMDGFLQCVRMQCDKYGCILIFDEVITGFRTSLGGAQKLFGVTPDLTVLGKAIGGGVFPVSAIVGKKDIMQLYADSRVIHGGTFNGYYLGQCAICATIETLQELNQYDKMLDVATQMKKIILEYAQDFKIPLIIQGHLSCASFHYSEREITSFSMIDNKLLFADSILRDCMRSYGILTCSPSRMYPTIIFSERDLVFMKDRMEDIMRTAQILLNRILDNEKLMPKLLSNR